MDTQHQLAVFGLCLCAGFIGGLLYEPFSLLRCIFQCDKGKNKPLGGMLDLAFWVLFSFLTVAFSYLFHFPSFRVYMWIGYLFGGILYLKSLHIIVAFLKNVCYNKVTKKIKKAKNRKKTLFKEVGKRL